MRLLTGSLAAFFLAIACVAAEPRATIPVEAGTPTTEKSSAITVTVDPRVELVAIAQHLSGYTSQHPKFQGRINDFDHPYLNRFREHFAPFKGHESLQRLAALGVGGSDPVGIAVQLSNPDELAFQGPVDRTLARTDNAAAYVENLRAFAQAVNFMAFFEANQDAYRAIVEDFSRATDIQNLAAPVASYCGSGPSRYVIVLAPLFGRTSFGPRVTAPDGTKIAYVILPPAGASEGRLTFGEASALAAHMCHEFGHSFINPLVEQHWNELAKYADLMQRVQYRGSGNYGREWKTCVAEHIDRAMTARIVLQNKGEAAYATQVSRDKERGFAFIEQLCSSLEVYEQNRAKYPNIDSYFPELVKTFARLHQSAAEGPAQS